METDWNERPIPLLMREAKRWLVWRFNHRGGGKPTKVPYYTSGKMRGKGIALDSPQDLANLSTFSEACAVAHKYSGIGFALGPDASGKFWQGIDLDGIQGAGLEELAERLPGYVERSPSLIGMHAIGLGRAFNTLGSNGTGIEAYCGKRYFTVTGDYVQGELCCIAAFVDSELRPLHSNTLHRGTESQESQESQESHAIEGGGGIVQKLPDYCRPTARGVRNNILFKLARRLKTLYPESSARDMEPIIRAWHAEYLDKIGTKAWLASWSEFRVAWERVKYAEGEGPLAETYGSIDMTQPVPPQLEALGYDQDLFRVVELCRLLAHRNGNEGIFFLSSRELAKLIGMSPPSASKVLAMLVADGILEVLNVGRLATPKGPRATDYRFVGWSPRD